MNIDIIKKSLLKLNNYCLDNNYKGYSLYDSHTSPLPLHLLGHYGSFIINQILKRSPINFRKLLKIEKQYNPKGMGLFLYFYTMQKKIGNPLKIQNIDDKILFFYNWLKKNYSKGYSGYCWGYHYPWPKSDGLLVPENTPNSVVTAFNIRAIFEYYLISKDKSCISIINGATKFILNDIPRIECKEGICFSYTPVKKDMTINANLLAAEVLVYSDYVNKTNRYSDLIKGVLNFTMAYQNNDGSWYYSFNPKSRKPKKQIDFHQGYVLETIKRICDFSSCDINIYNKEIDKGLAFYKEKQFNSLGVSSWRIPKKWPIDIHNQSQGIITFSIFKDYNNSYINFAYKIAYWTIFNMQGVSGNFYYQKWPLFTNRISYMRWNQGWMMIALSKILIELKE